MSYQVSLGAPHETARQTPFTVTITTRAYNGKPAPGWKAYLYVDGSAYGSAIGDANAVSTFSVSIMTVGEHVLVGYAASAESPEVTVLIYEPPATPTQPQPIEHLYKSVLITDTGYGLYKFTYGVTKYGYNSLQECMDKIDELTGTPPSTPPSTGDNDVAIEVYRGVQIWFSKADNDYFFTWNNSAPQSAPTVAQLKVMIDLFVAAQAPADVLPSLYETYRGVEIWYDPDSPSPEWGFILDGVEYYHYTSIGAARAKVDELLGAAPTPTTGGFLDGFLPFPERPMHERALLGLGLLGLMGALARAALPSKKKVKEFTDV